MPFIEYKKKRFGKSSRDIIDNANRIIEEYAAQGYDLTLRQLYYQFVARDLLANTPKNYKNLGSIVNDARLAGLIDWDRITDRTRAIEKLASWASPASIVATCASQFKIDFWKNQDYRPEVWIEKEALAGIFERVCNELRVPYLSCRGYTSQSEMWRASQRLESYQGEGKTPIIFHFGDHDPSGIDMSRDIQDRLELFMGGTEFKRLALNMNQVEDHNPPPNPAKISDSRAQVYIAKYGNESWELDALDPNLLSGLVRSAIKGITDKGAWEESIDEENEHRRMLKAVSAKWNTLTKNL
jgi:hypothetical protein